MRCEFTRRSRTALTAQFLSHEPENEITLTAFRLLILDLLSLFYVMNEGTINILGMTSTSDRPS
jgi:phosphatidylinositol-binding clathrin assembly protein